jgi:hypothetical protein
MHRLGLYPESQQRQYSNDPGDLSVSLLHERLSETATNYNAAHGLYSLGTFQHHGNSTDQSIRQNQRNFLLNSTLEKSAPNARNDEQLSLL